VIRHKTISIDDLTLFYREAGERNHPRLVLLHGFPASSHQYRDLIPALADRFHVVAPDYPGFGGSDMPDPDAFPYTFDRLSDVVERFLDKIGFTRFGLYVQDYGGPVGFRIVTRRPDWLEWLIVQNSNAYEVGFSPAWKGFREGLWLDRNSETEAAVAGLLEREAIRGIYLHGHDDPELISPDTWNMDMAFLERPGARRVQMELFYDYRTNPPLYPEWQTFLRERRPETLILWGQRDVFFLPEGGEAYLRDVPDAELHRLDSGHFATEDRLDTIVDHIASFHEERVVPLVGAAGGR